MKRFIALILSVGIVGMFGCQNVRYRARESYPASGLAFQPSRLRQEISIPKGQPYALHTLRATDGHDGQGLYYLQIRPGERLPQRYHSGQDLTLTGISGEATVSVEDRRYKAKAGTSVIIPSEHAYSVSVPQDGEQFSAYIVFSPPYDPDDVELTGE